MTTGLKQSDSTTCSLGLSHIDNAGHLDLSRLESQRMYQGMGPGVPGFLPNQRVEHPRRSHALCLHVLLRLQSPGGVLENKDNVGVPSLYRSSVPPLGGVCGVKTPLVSNKRR